MVQPTIQQKRINKRRPKIPKVDLQALPKKSRLQKIFNKNTVKVSYSCMPNLASIIKAHNNEVLKDNGTSPQKPCNCWKKDLFPLNGGCQSNNIIYNAEVQNMSRNETKVYIGLTEHPFKQRHSNHMQSTGTSMETAPNYQNMFGN